MLVLLRYEPFLDSSLASTFFLATGSSRTLLATARPLVRSARPTTATDTRTTTQGRPRHGRGWARGQARRARRGTSPPRGAAGAGAWDTEKPRERSRGHGKQRARHGMECGWAKGARVLARFRRQGAGRGGKHDEGLRGVRTQARPHHAIAHSTQGPSTLEERPAAGGGRAAGAALEHDMAVRPGRERAPGCGVSYSTTRRTGGAGLGAG